MDGGDRALAQKSIYIAGTRRLDNEALAQFLERRTGTRCEAVSFAQMETLGRAPHPPKSLLFLVDPLEQGLRAAAPQGNGRNSGQLPAGLFSVLFKEGPNGNGHNRAAAGLLCGFFYRFDSAERFVDALRDLPACRPAGPGDPPVAFVRPGSACDAAEGHPLSPREFHILFLMAGGLHNSDIAAHLAISGHTVRTHLYNIFRKIRVRSRVQASLWIHERVERFFCLI